MKKIIILIFLSMSMIFVSCDKKTAKPSTQFESKGEFLMLVVSDSLEYAIEYEKANEGALFYESPLADNNLYQEFIDGYYRYVIHPTALEMTGMFYVDPIEKVVVNFPTFNSYYPYIDSIPGSQLKKQFYPISLDSSQVDFVIPFYSNQWDGGGWKSAWDKVRNLKIVYEYRGKYPKSKVAFLCLKKSSGETKRYFFMNKYNP